MGTGALSLGVKWPGRGADYSPPSCAEVKECVELYLHSPNTPSWRGASLSTGITLPLPLRVLLEFVFIALVTGLSNSDTGLSAVGRKYQTDNCAFM
jgi:hypothetical protein